MPGIEDVVKIITMGRVPLVTPDPALTGKETQNMPVPGRRQVPHGRFLAIGERARERFLRTRCAAPPVPAGPPRLADAAAGDHPVLPGQHRTQHDALLAAERQLLAQLAPVLVRHGFAGQFCSRRQPIPRVAAPATPLVPRVADTRRFRNLFLPAGSVPRDDAPQGCPGCLEPRCTSACFRNGRLRTITVIVYLAYARRLSMLERMAGVPRDPGRRLAEVPLYRVYSHLSGHDDPQLVGFRRLRIEFEEGNLMIVYHGANTMYLEKARRLLCNGVNRTGLFRALRAFLEAPRWS